MTGFRFLRWRVKSSKKFSRSGRTNSSFSANERSFWGSWKRSWSQYSRNHGDDWIRSHHWSEKSSTVLYAIGTNKGALGFNMETEEEEFLWVTTSIAEACLIEVWSWKTKIYGEVGMKYIKMKKWNSTQVLVLLRKWHCLKEDGIGPKVFKTGLISLTNRRNFITLLHCTPFLVPRRNYNKILTIL